jgi:hypothetical protein
MDFAILQRVFTRYSYLDIKENNLYRQISK